MKAAGSQRDSLADVRAQEKVFTHGTTAPLIMENHFTFVCFSCFNNAVAAYLLVELLYWSEQGNSTYQVHPTLLVKSNEGSENKKRFQKECCRVEIYHTRGKTWGISLARLGHEIFSVCWAQHELPFFFLSPFFCPDICLIAPWSTCLHLLPVISVGPFLSAFGFTIIYIICYHCEIIFFMNPMIVCDPFKKIR